ncbi:MAG: tRNA adenosine(34) deaminase TadA, partial [Syntrophales bacterium]|nr:tRNA adenosine(34) deaminase TadA [Syntrophales bacterium]
MNEDELFMMMAIEESMRAYDSGEVPVGAVIVRDGAVLSRAHNRPLSSRDPTAHAEILAIRLAAAKDGNYRLPGTTLYVTIEPCIMCVGAIVQARISRLVYGAGDPKGGAVRSIYTIFDDGKGNHVPTLTKGVFEDQC